jgi:hypothetical protein
MSYTEPRAIHWTDDEELWNEYESARDIGDREPVRRSEIAVGDVIDVVIPDFLTEHESVDHTNLYNAEVTEVHYGVSVENDDGEWEYLDDHANEFVAECEGYTARVYCDRASWKLSLTPPDGAFTPDCNTAGLHRYPFQNPETDGGTLVKSGETAAAVDIETSHDREELVEFLEGNENINFVNEFEDSEDVSIIVEDDSMLYTTATDYARKCGYEVSWVGGGNSKGPVVGFKPAE